MRNYPHWFPRLLFIVLTVVFLSGCLLVPSALFFRLEWSVPWKLGGGPRNLAGAIHVALGFCIAALMGAVWTVHIRHNWKLSVNRRSGLGVIVVMALLGLTGLGCLYLGGERAAPFNSIGHILLGLAAPVSVAVHVVRGRRLARPSPRASVG